MQHASSTPQTFGFASVADLPEVTASILKNKFSEVVRLASREPLAITRHNRREFVIITAEHYDELQKSRLAPLKSLTAEFDQMVAKMNTPTDRAARRRFFKSLRRQAQFRFGKIKKKERAHAC